MARRAMAVADTTPDRSNDQLLLMPEIAELTRQPEATLRYLRHCGRGPRLEKRGRRLVAWKSDVLAWIEYGDDVA